MSDMIIDWLIFAFTGSDALVNIASVATIVLFGLGLMSYRANSKRIERETGRRMAEERKMASTNIYIELRDTLDGLNRDTHPEDALSFGTKDGQNMFFVNRIFNHDFYDSLICSGRISFLKPDLQQKIRDVFKNIKEHNEVLKVTAKTRDEFGDKIPPKAYEYYMWMDGCEQRLMEVIPEIQEELKKDFGVSPS